MRTLYLLRHAKSAWGEDDLNDHDRVLNERGRQTAPIAPWLYVLGAARFAVQQVDDFEGKPIQTWVYPQDRDAGFYDFAVPTKAAMEFYSDYVGPYAYDKLANITSPATGEPSGVAPSNTSTSNGAGAVSTGYSGGSGP